MADTAINSKYKDRLFRVLFNRKGEALSLYNALNDTDYTNADDLMLTSMDDVIYMGMKNDVSLLFMSFMHLWE